MNELLSLNVKYQLLTSKQDLQLYFDKLIDCCQSMLRKTGIHGSTCELLIRQMLLWVDTDGCYLLIGVDEEDNVKGFIFALLIYDTNPWVEVQALWVEPGLGVQLKEEVFNMMKQWARSIGANRIMAGITRSPDIFFEFFYEPLGFKKVGYILEAQINA